MTLSIRDVMTKSPHTIGIKLRLTDAKRVMDEHSIRHLPVLEGGALVGILSDRDVQMISALSQVDMSDVSVEEAMSQVPFTVSPGTSLLTAVRHMAKKKLGSAVVVENDKVVGVFTTTDGMRVLADLLDGTAPTAAPAAAAPAPKAAKKPVKKSAKTKR